MLSVRLEWSSAAVVQQTITRLKCVFEELQV